MSETITEAERDIELRDCRVLYPNGGGFATFPIEDIILTTTEAAELIGIEERDLFVLADQCEMIHVSRPTEHGWRVGGVPRAEARAWARMMSDDARTKIAQTGRFLRGELTTENGVLEQAAPEWAAPYETGYDEVPLLSARRAIDAERAPRLSDDESPFE